jgi:hypothetical protein
MRVSIDSRQGTAQAAVSWDPARFRPNTILVATVAAARSVSLAHGRGLPFGQRRLRARRVSLRALARPVLLGCRSRGVPGGNEASYVSPAQAVALEQGRLPVFARVTQYHGSKDKIDQTKRFLDADRSVTQKKGFKKAYFLADRATGKSLTITIWDSQEDMMMSSSPTSPMRAQINETLGGTQQPTVEEFELVSEQEPESRTTLLR